MLPSCGGSHTNAGWEGVNLIMSQAVTSELMTGASVVCVDPSAALAMVGPAHVNPDSCRALGKNLFFRLFNNKIPLLFLDASKHQGQWPGVIVLQTRAGSVLCVIGKSTAQDVPCHTRWRGRGAEDKRATSEQNTDHLGGFVLSPDRSVLVKTCVPLDNL